MLGIKPKETKREKTLVDAASILASQASRVMYGVVLFRAAARVEPENVLLPVGQMMTAITLPGLAAAGLSRGLVVRHSGAGMREVGLLNEALVRLLRPVALFLCAGFVVLALVEARSSPLFFGLVPVYLVVLAGPSSFATLLNSALNSIAAGRGKAALASVAVLSSMTLLTIVVLVSSASPIFLLSVVVAQPLVTTTCLTLFLIWPNPVLAATADEKVGIRSAEVRAAATDLRRLGQLFLLPILIAQGARVGFRAFSGNANDASLGESWEAIQRIGDSYWVGLGALISYLLLPRLKQTIAIQGQQPTSIFFRSMFLLMAVLGIVILAVGIAGDEILTVLYSPEISESSTSGLQILVLVDFVRAPAVLTSVLLLANERVRDFVLLEVFIGAGVVLSMAVGLMMESVLALYWAQFGLGTIASFVAVRLALNLGADKQ